MRLPWILAALLSASSVSAGDEKAEAPPAEADLAEARNRARALAWEGFLRFEARDYEAAIARFRRAEAIFHAPTHLLYIGRAQAKLGRLLEARDSLAKVADESLPGYAPAAFRAAQEDARAELAALRERIPRVNVAIRGVVASRVRIAIDGRPVAHRSEGYELAPGDHTITASIEGAEPVRRDLSVREGERREVTLELTPAPAPDPPPPVTADEAEEDHELLVPSLACFGLAGVSLVAGAVTGILSLAKVEALETRCVDGHCPLEAEPEADEARAFGHAATALFVVGGAAAAAGATLLIVGWPDSAPTRTGVRVRASITGLSVEGAF